MEKNDEYKSAEIQNEEPINSHDKHSAEEVVVIEQGAEIEVVEFPKEFLKRPFEEFDLRFGKVLLFSLVMHVLFLLIAPRVLPPEQHENRVKKVQKNFVDMLLTEDIVFDESTESDTEPVVWGALDEEAAKELSKMIEDIVRGSLMSGEDIDGLFEYSEKIATKEKLEKMVETMLPTAEKRREKRMQKAAERDKNIEEQSSQLSKVGLLGLVVSGSGAVNYDYIADILETASENSEHFEDILANLNALKIPRYKQEAFQNDVTDGLKSGRIINSKKDDFYKAVDPLAQVESTPIVRKTAEESEGGFLLAGLNRTKPANGKARKPSHLSKIVSGHNKAVQDCYKRVLKHQPGLKGKITVRIIIDPEGRVVQADILESTINNPKIEQCVLNRIRRWNNFGRCDPKIGDFSFKQTYRFGT